MNVNGFLGRRNQPAATTDNYVALTAEVSAHELGHLFGLRHSDSFGPLGLNPATGLPYGVFTAATAPFEPAAAVQTGPLQAAYTFKHTLISVAPRPQVGATAVPFLAPSGTIFDGTTPVATFVVNAQRRYPCSRQ